MSKKETVESVNIMEGINFKKVQYQERKKEKTKRIHKQEFARKQKVRKILLTLELIIIGIVIYNLTGIFGELSQINKFYEIMCIGSWAWLLIGQIATLIMIWEK